MRGVIVTADDFGLHERVNKAVELAHREGVLDCASLMVSGAAANDAVDRARRLPRLRVGLHIVLADGVPTSPLETIPELVDGTGRFGDRMTRDGFRFFFLPRVRQQLANEIRAQFEAFAATGLELDHVNSHKHFHLHPTVLSLILQIGQQFGMRAMRLPREAGGHWMLAPWAGWMKTRLNRAGIAHNDWMAGMSRTGRMDETAMLESVARAPNGVLELYSHPAVEGHEPITHSMRDYRHADELAALCSPRVAQAISATGAWRGAFSDIVARASPEGRNETSFGA